MARSVATAFSFSLLFLFAFSLLFHSFAFSWLSVVAMVKLECNVIPCFAL